MSLKVSDLTAGERLLIERRRVGLTQPEAAKQFRVSVSHYSRWERDKIPAPKTALPNLYDHEICLLLRRRQGITQLQLSKMMGRCRWRINQMEYGTVDSTPLVKYWKLEKSSTKNGKTAA